MEKKWATKTLYLFNREIIIMAKEWILNQANMRWGLTRKSKVGPVAELIRKCAPKN